MAMIIPKDMIHSLGSQITLRLPFEYTMMHAYHAIVCSHTYTLTHTHKHTHTHSHSQLPSVLIQEVFMEPICILKIPAYTGGSDSLLVFIDNSI